MNAIGATLSSIRIQPIAELPLRPQDTSTIATIYEMGPAGATFNPPVDLTIEYDESKIPEGVAEKSLVIVYYDDDTEQWTILESTVDTDNDTVTAKVNHFSAFTVLAYTRPASFTIADLSIIPGEIELGESVAISVSVTNNGDMTGTHQVELLRDDVLVEAKEVTLAGGDTEIITFNVTPEAAGPCMVKIDVLTDKYDVNTPKKPAAFTIQSLEISPEEVNVESSVTISVTVENTGELSGTYEVKLKINGDIFETEVVVLDGGQSEEVTFVVTEEKAGTYSVDINGQTDSFTVKEEFPQIVEPLPAAPAVQPASKPEPIPSPTTTKWWLIAIIAVGAVSAGAISYYFIRKKRSIK